MFGKNSVNVFSQNIKLNIYSISLFQGAEIGVFEGMWNYRHGEFTSLRFNKR